MWHDIMADEKAEPLLNQGGPEDCRSTSCRYLRYCGLLLLLIFAVVFLVCWIVQGIIYAYVMHGCSESSLANYPYSHGEGPCGDMKECGPEWNVMSRNQGLHYNDGWPSDSFDVTKASIFGHAGKDGQWMRFGGPMFTSYVFIDRAGDMSTVYMRRNMLRMGMSHRIARCDGKGPYAEVYEGSNYFMNRMRKNVLFQWLVDPGTDFTFKIALDGKHVADSLQSTSGGRASISFASLDGNEIFASGGQNAETGMWTIENDQNYETFHKSQPLPYWATSGVTTLFAFHKHRLEKKKEDKEHHDGFLEKPMAPAWGPDNYYHDEAADGAKGPASAKPDAAVDAAIPEAAANATAAIPEKQPAADAAAAAAVEKKPAAVAVAASVEKQATQAAAPVPAAVTEQLSDSKALITGPAVAKSATGAAAPGEVDLKSAIAAASPAAEVAQFT